MCPLSEEKNQRHKNFLKFTTSYNTNNLIFQLFYRLHLQQSSFTILSKPNGH